MKMLEIHSKKCCNLKSQHLTWVGPKSRLILFFAAIFKFYNIVPENWKLPKSPGICLLISFSLFLSNVLFIFWKDYKNVLHFISAGKCEIIIWWNTSWSKIFPFLLVFFNCNYNLYNIHYNKNIYINCLYSNNQFFICCLWLNINNITLFNQVPISFSYAVCRILVKFNIYFRKDCRKPVPKNKYYFGFL